MDNVWREVIFKIPIVDNINEFLLTKFLLTYQSQIDPLDKFPFIFAYEFPLHPEMTNVGKIDLILVDPNEKSLHFLIVEIKYLQTKSGKTSRTSRTKKRRKVEEQADLYTKQFALLFPNAQINAVYFTNENIYSRKRLSHLYEEYIKAEWEKIYSSYPILKGNIMVNVESQD
ncbi:MAG: hypothetical protein ACFFFG_06490 [Candidatus Thorarchaeota archaeon]